MIAFYNGFLRLERWFNGLSAAVLVCMMLLVTANIFTRYFFNSPIIGTLEFTEFFMVAAVYLALSYTQRLKGHIDIELVTSWIHPRKKLVCDLLVYIWGFVFFALIVWQGTEMTLESLEIEELTFGTIEVLLWPCKTLVPIGSLIICFRFIVDAVLTVKKIIGGET